MKKTASSFWSSLWQLFFPPLCYSCGRVLQHYENTLCLQCEISLPESHFAPDKPNPMQQRLAEYVPVEFATALFLFYPQGKIEQLLYQLKYKGQEKLSAYFGCWAARELPPTLFRQCTAVIPMPLHTKRQRKRGQSGAGICRKMGHRLGYPPKKRCGLAQEKHPTTGQRKGQKPLGRSTGCLCALSNHRNV